MKVKFSILIFILLSFFNIGAVSKEVINSKNSFSALETNIRSVSEFQENGVKLQYKTRDNIEKESDRIKQYLIKKINGDYREINKNQFETFDNNFHTNIKLWCEDKYTYVEITLINENAKYTTVDLKSILQKLEDQESENIQYLFYYEGKEKDLDNNYSIDKLANENNIQKINLLRINNGYTGNGYLSNGEKINLAIIRYNTGSHIIIGTPIIFAIY
ncbi:hypothetical protein psyc5s11_05820 [Clostridium gelidum]|uniref:TATA-box binding n=1 Tax=Clostridium gelidum TaxID=704125 RepID=A0ABM7SY55_9CLOT|nr:hypothetical protein [Clostridium gelidum]BCZ44515.1 hypothetical protein psyc5s11_05820 [Clostridium gelidum]